MALVHTSRTDTGDIVRPVEVGTLHVGDVICEDGYPVLVTGFGVELLATSRQRPIALALVVNLRTSLFPAGRTYRTTDQVLRYL